jgi:hypothetical protein
MDTASIVGWLILGLWKIDDYNLELNGLNEMIRNFECNW